jgi:hypothetical protein
VASSSFGLDAESVRRHFFPNADAFSASSRPSSSTVAEVIEEEAAAMAGALSLESISADAIAVASSAYRTCRRILRMQVAAKLIRLMSGVDTELAKSWDVSVADWYAKVASGGASFLGDGASTPGEADPDGPTWHGTGLTQDTQAAQSSTVPALRKDDRL